MAEKLILSVHDGAGIEDFGYLSEISQKLGREISKRRHVLVVDWRDKASVEVTKSIRQYERERQKSRPKERPVELKSEFDLSERLDASVVIDPSQQWIENRKMALHNTPVVLGAVAVNSEPRELFEHIHDTFSSEVAAFAVSTDPIVVLNCVENHFRLR